MTHNITNDLQEQYRNFTRMWNQFVISTVGSLALFLNLLTIFVIIRFCKNIKNHMKLVLHQCVVCFNFTLCCVLLPTEFDSDINRIVFWVFYYFTQDMLILNMMLIAIEHFIAHYTPFKYKQIMTNCNTIAALILSYGIMILFHILVILAALDMFTLEETEVCQDLKKAFRHMQLFHNYGTASLGFLSLILAQTTKSFLY